MRASAASPLAVNIHHVLKTPFPLQSDVVQSPFLEQPRHEAGILDRATAP
jgi:hypothetical protein